jgi:hypothetical protein
MIELKNSKTTYLGKASDRDRYALDAFIGAVQMREPEGQWQDIKPRLVRDADGWHIEGAPYYAEIKDDGSRLFCPDRNEVSKYLRLPGVALFSGLSKNAITNPAKLDGEILPNQITMPTEWGEIHIIFSNTGMHFEILFRQAPPADLFGKDSPRILLDAETMGFDIEQLLKSASGTGIPKPRLIAANLEALTSESQEKWLEWSYKNGQLELGFDFGDLQFPILLKNTTIDVQVGASANDGYASETLGFNNSGNSVEVGYDGPYLLHSFYRFTGITIPQSSTIGVCYVSLYEIGSVGTPLTKIYFEKANDPAAVTSYANYIARTLTTAGVDWDGDPGGAAWYNSASLVSVAQELINAYGLSNQAIQVMHKDDGSTSPNNYRGIMSQDYSDHTYGAKLHIEYSTGGATAKNSNDSGAGADSRLSFLASLARADTGGGSESVKGRGLVINDSGGGADALTALIAAVLAAETGSGVEQSTLSSIVAKLSAETGSGVDIAGLVARLASSEVGHGADTGMILGLKSIFGGDGGIGCDALKALIGTSGGGSDMKLPGRPGQVRIPSKGVSL